ncbi:hemagglutinin repeat-containing protein [Pseudomonas chlororaphis]|uniref:hemagglutinin repeat-containing protein n=1 Tax=Pseudomonas chlororaphis TaxID=587753 RepID=UPI000E0A04CA|nr:hemagglutinin repeat-containing protein [Pseudomonas chlororaphis]AZD17103.1 Putative hemolysin/cytolysin secreted via TPS pathway [Pseudomonas chlororaphis]WDH45690.1 hemagglutinin repeat-containing protein [Pseudomonas chlororaphis]WDH57537.1 hemagglutinin repeat-containing protein [Pseudomonas chlororaphis]WQE16794.1 hemagglutinin repeat-containing protein [Pseudomonas chlororaphis]
MPDNTSVFHLSPRGKLRLAIASLLLVSHLPQALAGGITVAPGPGGIPQLQNQNGVPIVNIVAPNGAGLSHNQFLDYNVDRQGVVLNNALQAGASQLAGQLAANPQFHGQDASVILNEVISRNASALNGAQEIFGRAADYVLANPNGISVNGGSFINTPNASLLVGRPELNDGKLQALSTRDAKGQLTVEGQGLSNAKGSINLIAPRIDSQGDLTAGDQLNLTVGRNRVDPASGKVLSTDPAGNTKEQRIDASLFGAMQAGRINIVSTAEGAGVRVGAVQVKGRDGVDIASAGDLHISGQARPDSLDAIRAGVHSSQGDVQLRSGQDLSLAATDVSARDIKLDAGRNLTLSAIESRKLQEKREQWHNSTIGITWETYDRTLTDSDSRQHGNQLTARRDAELKARANTEIQASQIKAKNNLTVDSGADLRLTAATETHEQRDQGRHRKHLWKADWDKSSSEQRSITSQLEAKEQLQLTSRKQLQLQGAELASNNIELTGRQVDITSASRTQSNSDKSYSGDLVGGSFFGKNGDGDKGKTLNKGSKVNAKGDLIVKADEVRISGSQARGGKQASVISENGSLIIDGVQDRSHDNSYSKDSKFFGITKDESRQNRKDSTTVTSDLRSDSNLELKSTQDIAISGAQVTATGKLEAKAGGDIKIDSAQDTTQSEKTTHTRGFDAYAKENAPGTRQYRAGVRYEDQQKTVKTSDTQQQGSSLSGGSLEVAAKGNLSIKGGDLKATQGDASLSGQQVELLADHDSKTESTDTRTTGGGFYYTGGLDRAGNGVEFAHSSTQDTRDTRTANTTGINATGNLTIKAGNTLVTEGAQVKAGDKLLVKAEQVDNRAARDSESTSHKENTWSADIGANVEYKGLARPVEKAIEGVAQRKFHQPGLLDALEQPNVGLDVEVGHQNKQRTEQGSTAVVSQFTGGQVEVKVAGQLQDEGSRYEATQGALKIDAGSQVAKAASDTHSSSEQALDAKAGVRVYTTTGEDVNVRGSGAGGSSDKRSDSSKAVVGSYVGKQGVDIALNGDGQYEGSRFDGGDAGVKLHSGGELALNQANDRQSSSDSSLRGDASLTVGSAPGANGNNLNLGAGVQLDHKRLDQQDSQARVATIQGKGPVELTSGGDLILQGTTIGSKTAKTGDINLNAGGKLDLQAAVDTHSSQGSNLGGGLTGGASKTSSEQSSGKSANLSANFNIGRVSEQDQNQTGGQLHSNGQVTLASGSDSTTALHLQGTQVEAKGVTLSAEQGGIYQESAQSTQAHNNWGLTLGAGGNGGKTTRADAGEHDSPKTDRGIHARAKIDVEQLHSTTQHNSLIKADQVTLNSNGDTHLAGARIDANQVDGRIGGDLKVESRKDQLSSTTVNLDARLDAEKNQPGVVDKLTKQTGPLKDKLQAKAEGGFDKHREKLENVVDKGTERLTAAKDNLVNKAEIAKERLGEKFTRSGSYDVNPEPKGAFGRGVDKAKSYLADKTEALGDRFSSLKERVWPKTSDSYAVSEKTGAGSKLTNTAQGVLFGDKSGNTSYTPTLNLNVSRQSKDSVAEASGISGSRGVNLQVSGETQLSGARIGASEGKVDLGGSTVKSTALAGTDYRADVGLNLSKSPVNLALGAKDELTRKQDDATRNDQAFNLGPLRVGGHSDSQLLQAGIDQKAP